MRKCRRKRGFGWGVKTNKKEGIENHEIISRVRNEAARDFSPQISRAALYGGGGRKGGVGGRSRRGERVCVCVCVDGRMCMCVF